MKLLRALGESMKARDAQLLINFGKKIKRLRSLKGLTQAELCQLSGVNRYTLMKYEQMLEAPPSMETIIRLCQALEVSSDYLLGLKEINRDFIAKEMDKL